MVTNMYVSSSLSSCGKQLQVTYSLCMLSYNVSGRCIKQLTQANNGKAQRADFITALAKTKHSMTDCVCKCAAEFQAVYTFVIRCVATCITKHADQSSPTTSAMAM